MSTESFVVIGGDGFLGKSILAILGSVCCLRGLVLIFGSSHRSRTRPRTLRTIPKLAHCLAGSSAAARAYWGQMEFPFLRLDLPTKPPLDFRLDIPYDRVSHRIPLDWIR